MYKRILAATDGSEFANRAVDAAAALAAKLDSQLVIVTVSEPLPVFAEWEIGGSLPDDIYERMRKIDAAKARGILEDAAAIARQYDRSPKTVHIDDQWAHAGILQAAKAHQADLIVLASRSKTLVDKILLGSQASKVLTLADVPVLVVTV